MCVKYAKEKMIENQALKDRSNFIKNLSVTFVLRLSFPVGIYTYTSWCILILTNLLVHALYVHCNKTFRRKDNLLKHIQVHNPESHKRVPCGICGANVKKNCITKIIQ